MYQEFVLRFKKSLNKKDKDSLSKKMMQNSQFMFSAIRKCEAEYNDYITQNLAAQNLPVIIIRPNPRKAIRFTSRKMK